MLAPKRVVEKPQNRLFRQRTPKPGTVLDCALKRSANLCTSYGDALFEDFLGT